MASLKAVIISISSDIGHALALGLHAEGWQVCGTYRMPSEQTKQLTSLGMKLYRCDLAAPGDTERCADQITKEFGFWDFLVLAPGSQEPVGLFAEVGFKAWADGVAVNFTEQLHFIHRLLPTRNPKTPHGPSVLLFAGGGTNNATARYSAYTISKIALIKMSELLDKEMPDTRFTILGPGWVRTKIHQATIDAKEKAGDNLTRTLDRFARNEFVPMEKVVACCKWVFNAPREAVGGRNFSVANDAWENPKLVTRLKTDADMYKLRRAGNDWKP